MTDAPVVRVVVVTWSPGPHLTAFLDSLPSATSQPYEVVVADNSPVPDGAVLAAAARPGVRVLPTGGNLGYGRAANAGAAGATAPWLLVANPDIVLRPGAVDELLARASRWPRGGAFGPAIHTPDGELYPSARRLPSLAQGVGHAAFGWCWPSNPWTAAYRNERGAPVEGSAGWLSGSVQLLRREAFEGVGGFDPAYFMYFEDVDLGKRLGEQGWLNVYVPSAVVVHDGGHAANRPEVAAAMLDAHHASTLRYLSGVYAGPAWSPVRLGLRLGLKARAAVARRSSAVSRGASPTRRA